MSQHPNFRHCITPNPTTTIMEIGQRSTTATTTDSAVVADAGSILSLAQVQYRPSENFVMAALLVASTNSNEIMTSVPEDTQLNYPLDFSVKGKKGEQQEDQDKDEGNNNKECEQKREFSILRHLLENGKRLDSIQSYAKPCVAYFERHASPKMCPAGANDVKGGPESKNIYPMTCPWIQAPQTGGPTSFNIHFGYFPRHQKQQGFSCTNERAGGSSDDSSSYTSSSSEEDSMESDDYDDGDNDKQEMKNERAQTEPHKDFVFVVPYQVEPLNLSCH